MRRVMSDPVGSGVDSFTKILTTFDQLENSQMRRQLLSQELADRKLKNERDTMVFNRQQKTWDEEDEKKYGQKNLNNISSVYEMQQKADSQGRKLSMDDLSDDQTASILYMAGEKGLLDDKGKIVPNKLEAIKTLQSLTKIQSPEIEAAVKNKAGVNIDLTKNKKLSDALHEIYGNEINEGVDRAGNVATKKATNIYLDFSQPVPTVTFGLDVSIPKTGVGNLIPLSGYEKNVFSIPEDPQPKGQIERGNIDLSQRKVALNDDGSISTVRTIGIEHNGKEVLIPTIGPDGKSLTEEEAVKSWEKTISKDKPFGDHLGVFDSAINGTAYAEKLHSSKLWQPSLEYYNKDIGSYPSVMTWGRDGSPDAQVKQIPAPLLTMQLTSLEKLGDWVNQLEAKYGSTKYSEKVQALRKTKAENAAAVEAFDQSGGDARKFVQLMIKKNPEMPIKDTKTLFEVFSKGRPKMESQIGKQLSDQEELEKTYGKDSPQVKKFTESVNTNKKGGANKTIYGPNGQTKEVFIDKGQDYTPPAGWSLKAPEKPEKDKSMTTEVDKLDGLAVKSYRKGDKNKETINDLDLDDEEKKELQEKMEKATKLIKEKKMSASEAWREVDKVRTLKKNKEMSWMEQIFGKKESYKDYLK